MSTKFPKLFSRGRIGPVNLANRIVFLPHFTAFHTSDGTMQEQHLDYFEERAKGGTGLLVVGSHAVSEESRMSSRYENALNPDMVNKYKELSARVHAHGAKVFIQFTHGGHTTLSNPPHLLYAPSQMSEPSCYYNTKEMEIEDIEKVIQQFATCAEHARRGGCDGVEIKGAAHDGLLRSFISPFFNRREDRYGGSFENRMRLPLEVVHAIRRAIGPELAFGVRVCMDEFTPWGYGVEEGKRITKAFAETGEVDYFSCDAGSFSSFYMEIPPSAIPLGFAEHLSAAMKEVTDLPVIAFGRINDPVMGERFLQNGSADFIGMARALICDPEFAAKAREDRDDDVRHCIGCQDGCIYQVMQNEAVGCIHNPAAGREKRFGVGTLTIAKARKKISVIGAGPAGLKVSEILARRGHSVTVYESAKEVGGQVLLASSLPHREEVADVTRYLKIQADKLGVNFVLEKTMGASDVLALATDAVIVATGSRPLLSDFAGSARPKVSTVHDIIRNPNGEGRKIILFDRTRGWPGIGTAELLVNSGKEVILAAPTDTFGGQIEPGSVQLLYHRVLGKGLTLCPSHDLTSIKNGEVQLVNVYSDKTLLLNDIDIVVLSLGSASERSLYDALKGKVRELYRIGDAVAPRMIQQAILDAEILARSIGN